MKTKLYILLLILVICSGCVRFIASVAADIREPAWDESTDFYHFIEEQDTIYLENNNN